MSLRFLVSFMGYSCVPVQKRITQLARGCRLSKDIAGKVGPWLAFGNLTLELSPK